MTERPTNWRSIRKEELEDANYRCRNCKRKGGEYGEVDLEVHHTVPLSQNGNSNLDNLRALCKGCHKTPHSKDAVAPNHVSEPEPEPESEPDFWNTWHTEELTEKQHKSAALATFITFVTFFIICYVGYTFGGNGSFLLSVVFGIPVSFLIAIFISEKMYPPEPKYLPK